jgi:hypothetical protein
MGLPSILAIMTAMFGQHLLTYYVPKTFDCHDFVSSCDCHDFVSSCELLNVILREKKWHLIEIMPLEHLHGSCKAKRKTEEASEVYLHCSF